ncbi:MAG: AAA family ATPase [Halobacteriovoraceae bacterium]|nr:AAA family ATPase [Halobacteriovoraceae bacterium]|tara:strand:- start:330168 stop:331076 length:909 start_codon:yes stop_codon:yes gene_type:complete
MKELELFYKHGDKFLSGKKDKIELALCNLLAQGHTLIEDLPGVGKTTLVTFFSEVFDLKMSRTQFTNDLLPSDIIGNQVFNRKTSEFEFHQGPIFGEIFMADELNRAPPKTQSALLQAMEEKSVTVDSQTFPMERLFHVIATQNPKSQIGTFELPESQLDRFSMKLELGYPDEENTIKLLKEKATSTKIQIEEKISKSWLLESISACEAIEASDAILSYIFRLVDESRNNSHFMPLSNRAAIDLLKSAKAWAWMNEETHVFPEHVQHLLPYVVGHRLCHPSEGSASLEKELSVKLIGSVSVR